MNHYIRHFLAKLFNTNIIYHEETFGSRHYKNWQIENHLFFLCVFFRHSLECSSPKPPKTHFRFNLPNNVEKWSHLPNKAKLIGECRQKGKMNSPLPSRFFCTCHKKKTICVTKYCTYHHWKAVDVISTKGRQVDAPLAKFFFSFFLPFTPDQTKASSIIVLELR